MTIPIDRRAVRWGLATSLAAVLLATGCSESGRVGALPACVEPRVETAGWQLLPSAEAAATFKLPPKLHLDREYPMPHGGSVWRDGPRYFYQTYSAPLSAARASPPDPSWLRSPVVVDDESDCQALIGGMWAYLSTYQLPGGPYTANGWFVDTVSGFDFVLSGSGPTPADQQEFLAALRTVRLDRTRLRGPR
ncbi:MAG TPA: hypothetical protein VFM74_03300 [Candidatus Limnocylindria bacterium]|nr:hypothetical protein [Candidatus Limnocylindria bacterium]